MNREGKKRINRNLGKAINDWNMIDHRDRILVGVSGGIDSFTLLHLLVSLKKRAPVEFDILPVYIDPGFDRPFSQKLAEYVFSAYGLNLTVLETDHGVKAHSGRIKENPCFACSRLRRKTLFEMAREKGCKKIALGHNKDDIIETLFLNICYAGKIAAMKPVQSFFKGTLDIIRPLSYVEKKEVRAFALGLALPEFENNCPSANLTKRGEIREMLEALYRHNKNIKGNIFRSMGNIRPEYLLER